MSILIKFKAHDWIYEVYNTAASIFMWADVLEIPVFWIWRILISASLPGHFLD